MIKLIMKSNANYNDWFLKLITTTDHYTIVPQKLTCTCTCMLVL